MSLAARAYDCDAGWVAQLGRPAHEQERRRVRDLAQIWWIVGVGPFDKARADVRQLAQFFLKRFEIAKLGDTARLLRGTPAAAISSELSWNIFSGVPNFSISSLHVRGPTPRARLNASQ